MFLPADVWWRYNKDNLLNMEVYGIIKGMIEWMSMQQEGIKETDKLIAQLLKGKSTTK